MISRTDYEMADIENFFGYWEFHSNSQTRPALCQNTSHYYEDGTGSNVEFLFNDSMNRNDDETLFGNFSMSFHDKDNLLSQNLRIFFILISSLLYDFKLECLLQLLENSGRAILFYFPVIKISLVKLQIFHYAQSKQHQSTQASLNALLDLMDHHKLKKAESEKCFKRIINESEVFFESAVYISKHSSYLSAILNVISCALLNLYNYKVDDYLSTPEIFSRSVIELNNIEFDIIQYLVSYNETDAKCFPFIKELGITKSQKLRFTSSEIMSNSPSIDCSLASNTTQADSSQHKEQSIKFLIEAKGKLNIFCVHRSQNLVSALYPTIDHTFLHNCEPSIRRSSLKKNQKFMIMKEFPFKVLKRENIDKKIMRKFRRYIALTKKQELRIDEFSYMSRLFINNRLFPPLRFNGTIFKSFSSSYMAWIFTQAELIQLYKEYIGKEIDNLIKYFIKQYDANCDIESLRGYLIDLPSTYKEYGSKNLKMVN